MSEAPVIYETLPSVRIARGTQITRTGLVIQGDLSIEEWAALRDQLAMLGNAIQFAIGDWLNYGELRYGETYTQFAEMTGYRPGSLMNMKWVSARIEPSRRRESLSWSFHADVAALVPSEQDYWLDCVESEGWTRKQLRDELHPDIDGVFETLECPACGHRWEAS